MSKIFSTSPPNFPKFSKKKKKPRNFTQKPQQSNTNLYKITNKIYKIFSTSPNFPKFSKRNLWNFTLSFQQFNTNLYEITKIISKIFSTSPPNLPKLKKQKKNWNFTQNLKQFNTNLYEITNKISKIFSTSPPNFPKFSKKNPRNFTQNFQQFNTNLYKITKTFPTFSWHLRQISLNFRNGTFEILLKVFGNLIQIYTKF